MTREDIIRMAREAGWVIGPATLSGLERFAHLVAAHERDRLAQPEQEPVAKYSDIVSEGELDPRNKFDAPPLRPWVGLTDEEVVALQDFAYADDIEFIRNVENKLKEKNK